MKKFRFLTTDEERARFYELCRKRRVQNYERFLKRMTAPRRFGLRARIDAVRTGG